MFSYAYSPDSTISGEQSVMFSYAYSPDSAISSEQSVMFTYTYSPDSAISNEQSVMFSSGTSWSSRTRMAIMAAAPVATVASIRKMW